MELILTFFSEFLLLGSAWLFWIFFVAFFSILFRAETDDAWKVSFIALGVGGFILWKWSNFPIIDYLNLINIGTYIVIGFTFALIRTYIFGRKTKGDDFYKTQLRGKIANWWFFWPISFLSWVFSDLLKDLYDLIYSKVSLIFEKIYSLGVPENK